MGTPKRNMFCNFIRMRPACLCYFFRKFSLRSEKFSYPFFYFLLKRCIFRKTYHSFYMSSEATTHSFRFFSIPGLYGFKHIADCFCRGLLLVGMYSRLIRFCSVGIFS